MLTFRPVVPIYIQTRSPHWHSNPRYVALVPSFPHFVSVTFTPEIFYSTPSRKLGTSCEPSEWQVGFRSQRGYRDKLLLLRVLYDQITHKKTSFVITSYSCNIHWSYRNVWFDLTPLYGLHLGRHRSHEKTQINIPDHIQCSIGDLWKWITLHWRQVYLLRAFWSRVRRHTRWYHLTCTLHTAVMTLDQLVQLVDKSVGSGVGEGVKCGSILKLTFLGYVDDDVLIET